MIMTFDGIRFQALFEIKGAECRMSTIANVNCGARPALGLHREMGLIIGLSAMGAGGLSDLNGPRWDRDLVSPQVA